MKLKFVEYISSSLETCPDGVVGYHATVTHKRSAVQAWVWTRKDVNYIDLRHICKQCATHACSHKDSMELNVTNTCPTYKLMFPV